MRSPFALGAELSGDGAEGWPVSAQHGSRSRPALRSWMQPGPGIDDLWVADHLALAPEDSEGSDGRYLEPLATLAFLAGITERVGLGVGVLIVPYRPALLTAKWIASI
jgi:hypothetical protein